jgi:hypothetical protein
MTAPTTLDDVAYSEAMRMAGVAERAADTLCAAYAGITAISAATGSPKLAAVAGEVGRFVEILVATEMALRDAIDVPVDVRAALDPYADQIAEAGRSILVTVPAPQPGPGTYADGVKTGFKRAQLLAQAQRLPRGGLRRR